MTRTEPTYAHPGQPEGAWWHPLAFLGGLFLAGVVGWAAVAGVVWLVWLVRAYLVTAGAVLLVSAVVTFCAWLAVKGNTRARALAAGIFAGLVGLVLWTVQR